MISTENHSLLPNRTALETTCKAISVLDAILSADWEFRYYSFNSKWDVNEKCLQMRNGSGDEMHILFHQDGCAINGFAHEFEPCDKEQLTANLPTEFNEFIYGEPVQSIGTTFCLWSTNTNEWQTGEIYNHENNSKEMLSILDGKPQTYVDWATEYFDESFIESGLPIKTVTEIYNGTVLTRPMVLSIVRDHEDWNQLEKDLLEIGYPFDFKSSDGKKAKWKCW